MERYERIINNDIYRAHILSIEKCEEDRIFCHHDTVHFMDVARIGMIINVTEGYGIPKDIIYATALLHDIGRDIQYANGTPHEITSLNIANDILSDTDYNEAEINEIINAIGNHRNAKIKDEKNLSGLIYRADKLSRACYFCKAYDECNWKNDKKNGELIW